jgi:DNA-binding GntR family transcriptional regulator
MELQHPTEPRRRPAAIDLAAPMGAQLFRLLRQEIVEMRQRPGAALSEKEIATRFGVSRQPVREAFIKLAEAGLVRVLPNRGTFVMKISVRAVADARLVREAVECAIARTACRTATAEDKERLASIIAVQREAAAADDQHGFLEADEAFHRALAEIADCAYAWRVVEEVRAQMDRVRFLSLPDASPMPLLIEQHDEILAAVRRNDPDAAEAATQVHLREILIALPALAARHPDLFEAETMPIHTADLVGGVDRAG